MKFLQETSDANDCIPGSTNAIGQEVATSVSIILKALADPLRLRILSAIASDPRGESCVCDLTSLANVSQPTVSHHLKLLKDAGILLSQRRATWVWYRINPASRTAVTTLLESFAPAAISKDSAQNQPPALLDLDTRVLRLSEELADEFPTLSSDLVTAIVRDSYIGLMRSARVKLHILALTEKFARQRLHDLTRDKASGVPQVLFVCVQNAGRSQLAAALVNQLAQGKVVARSAGSVPAQAVHPQVRPMLADIVGKSKATGAFPKPLTDDAVRAANVVVTMGCGDICPIIPGVRYEDWAIADPALASPEGLRVIRDDIEARVHALIDSLNND